MESFWRLLFASQVDYHTFDISAVRDVKYVGAKGTIRFERGRTV